MGKLKAVKKGVDAVARKLGDPDLPDSAYRGNHTAPTDPEDHAPLHEMNLTYPDDIYSAQAARFYGHGDPKLDQPTFDLINSVRGNPDAQVDMYRAVPSDSPDEILPGDWVTPNYRYAEQHGEGLGDYKVLRSTTDAKRLRTDGNSPHEFGYTGALGAAAVGIGASTQSEDADAGVITKGGKKLIEAFHGSPHKFDKFSMDNIGTGEGAQAYGHGLYFADSEDVAREYRSALTNKNLPDGFTHPEKVAFTIARRDPNTPSKELVHYVKNVYPDMPDDEAIAALDKAKGALQPGGLYRAHIDVDPDTLLDWDKPLSEQPDAVKTALGNPLAEQYEVGLGGYGANKYQLYDKESGFLDTEMPSFPTEEAALDFIENPPASSVYELLSGGPHGPAQSDASQRLREAGIPGIRYADGMSRGKEGEQTFNYVMFDDKPISIQERGNATPEALAATAMASAAAAFSQRRQEKQGRYQAVRERLLNAVTKANQAATFALEAIEIPMQGYHGLTALAGDLAAGNSFEDSMMRAGTVARQPIEQTAYDLGGVATDATGSPLIGTAVNVGAQIMDPF